MAPSRGAMSLLFGSWNLKPFGGEAGRDDRLEVLGQHRGVPGVGLHGRVQLVAQAEAQRQVSRRLPDVVDEEPVAPAADVALDLVGGRDHRARQPEHEVGHRVAGDVAGEVEEAARVVRRPPAGRQPPQVEPGADVVRAARVGEHVRHLERRVELVPVRAAGAEPAEVADVDAGDAGIVVLHVAVEPGNAERRAGVRPAVHGEVVQRVEVDAVVADPEVVVAGSGFSVWV